MNETLIADVAFIVPLGRQPSSLGKSVTVVISLIAGGGSPGYCGEVAADRGFRPPLSKKSTTEVAYFPKLSGRVPVPLEFTDR